LTLTIAPTSEALAEVRERIHRESDRRERLARSVHDNLRMAADFLEACRHSMKRLDFAQASLDAEAADDHRHLAQQAAIEIRFISAQLDLERRVLNMMRKPA
jgi:hypothetical protein